ncbi:asparaginase [Microbacterium sp. EYE_5]|uniref:asparaginase n=1 Tax=unclassified Microbacterium TaxID=2609290 RepID=UPI002005AB22|nr:MULTISPECIES: asparaginase [unclassified Microbacterium]MCK6081390.1 asparaginase [Microbacterium sp. EYE_382]MCK6086660.1 asparaginase [Microbacterium sp. EYE_384]MCK6123842.1 asparaginase [Microbacterium sp. EYE_80]MCK6126751.1 asparaginase [Microbacterium sp. EYE_79]MCK6142345.1 asparaginase [Microbacterium sp. EYE_39]
MPETFAVTDAAELAVVERSGFVESRHSGSAVVLDPDGAVITSLGSPDAVILPRSTMKPMQALASVTAGAALEGPHLAVATASHSGTDRHVALVTDILTRAGLGEDDLLCPPAWPSDAATRDEMTRELIGPQRVRMNCSGKHAAMLLACQANGWDTATYLDASHPLQIHTREVVERLTGTKVSATAIDGCGAPVHAMSLSALARAIHRIGASSERSPFALHRSAGALVRAVREHPWVIQGPGQPDSVVTERLGVFAKHGAEGVMAMVAPDGTTVAMKVLDGSNRVSAVTALTLLVRAGALQAADVARTLAELPLTVTGGGRDVGVIRPTV